MSTSNYVCTLPPARPVSTTVYTPLVVYDSTQYVSSSANDWRVSSTSDSTGSSSSSANTNSGTSSSSSSSTGDDSTLVVDGIETVPYQIQAAPTTTTASPGPDPKQCHDVQWGHLASQLTTAAVPWGVLTLGGLALTTFAPHRVGASRATLQKYRCGLASRGMGPALTVLAVHAAQCFFFVIRSSTGVVDPIYYALETIGALYLGVDIIARWMHVVSGGTRNVISDALSGPLLLDMLVGSSVVGISIEGYGGVGLTWWSFNFSAALRMTRIIRLFLDAGPILGHWRRLVLFHVLKMALFVFSAAGTIMTMESLEVPAARADENSVVWDLFPSMAFVCMTIMSIGNSSLAPSTGLGRVMAVLLIAWGYHHIATRVVPILSDTLMGKAQGLGTYKPTERRHLVVLGTPTGSTLWDFLLETFHPNHFKSALEFDDEAPCVVIMLPDETTLMHMSMILKRPEALFFRDKVVLLSGDAFVAEDIERAAVPSAERVIILPDTGIADVKSNDEANIMRSYALEATTPYVPVICLLHSAEHKHSSLSGGGQCSYVSIDALKMAMIASACMTPGALSMICNLFKTIGDMSFSGKPWQVEYEISLGYEVYEVPLNVSYHLEHFQDAVWDILCRSEAHDVFLIGLVEVSHGGGVTTRNVKINPGAEYRLLTMDDNTSGVFIAPDISSIVLCKPSENMIRRPRNDGGSQEWGSSSSFDAAESSSASKASNNNGNVVPGHPILRTPGSKSLPVEDNAELLRKLAEAYEPLPAEVRLERIAVSKYDESLNAIKRRMLVNGIAPDVVAEAVGLSRVEYSRHKKEPRLSDTLEICDFVPGSKTSAMSVGEDKLAASSTLAASMVAESIAQLQAHREVREMGSDSGAEVLRKVKALNARKQAMANMLLAPPPPPPQRTLDKGGHVLICVVSDTVTSSARSQHFEASLPIGIGHFVKLLRDDRLLNTVGQPTVVVLAEMLPEDWHTVVQEERVYFVQGSGLEISDLQKTRFHLARAIVVVRAHTQNATAERAADTRMILATHVIESNLPRSSQIPIITDHAYNGTCEFLPSGILTSDDIGSLVSPQEAPLPATPAQESPWTRWFRPQDTNIGSELGSKLEPQDEDYHELDSCDYAHHPRWMRGDMFVAGCLTSLVANTLYNPTLVPLISAMIDAPYLLLQVPVEWIREPFEAFMMWLLEERNMLALGIYRNSAAVQETTNGERVASVGPTLDYMYTTPPGRTRLVRSDRVLCVAPCQTDE